MKVEILKSFVDRYNKQHNVGDVVEMEDSRCIKAEQLGIAKIVNDVEEKPKAKKKVVKK